jgi:lipoate-protein ligase B
MSDAQSGSPVIQFRSLQGADGPLVSYADARALQLELVECRSRDEIPDTVLFLEHKPVITQGRGLQFTGEARDRHMPVPVALPEGVEFSESERGGDLTFHGPGQLVIYPICKLDGQGFGPKHDVAGFLRKLEGAIIDDLKETHALPAAIRTNATGVWIGDLKIASIGIAVRRWVTYHGAAINCVNDLRDFGLISPCGYSPEVMTRLLDWVPELAFQRLEPGEWRRNLESRLASRMLGRAAAVSEVRLDEVLEALPGSAAPVVALAQDARESAQAPVQPARGREA